MPKIRNLCMKILDKINSPSDLKLLDEDKLPILAEEIREFLIDKVEKCGGHLASNLGIVELTIAIHRVFDIPTDHLIFDVGHQSYVHKIFTGRKKLFDELRIPGGLSGFTSMKESECDAFGAGHSSTSVSAALGFAEADRLNGSSSHTVCVIGDGAYTGGMVHEALNNCKPELPLIIILNENGMSISNNRGTFASYLAGVRISQGYVKWKKSTNTFLEKIPLIGKGLKWLLSKTRDLIKGLIYDSNYFEDLGLYYIGPIDGHNIKKLEKSLTEAKKLGKTVVVHIKTQKGKGYEPAEKFPDEYHSVSAYTPTDTFHSVAASKLLKIAEEDEKVVAVTAAMGIGTGLDKFGELFPKRYFDVGIAEEHALTFSAGLAANGLKPFVGIYSTFLQRGYDNIIHDIALQSLPVKILIDRAGLSVRDGATHHGIFDVSFLSHIPNMTVYAPATFSSLEKTIELACECSSPIALRYSNSTENSAVTDNFQADEKMPLSYIKDFDGSEENVFITYGQISGEVIRAKDLLLKSGIDCGIIILEKLKPLDYFADRILPTLKAAKNVVFVEEGIKNGGIGMILGEMIHSSGLPVNIKYTILAINDTFTVPTEICDIYDYAGISAEKLAKKIMEMQ